MKPTDYRTVEGSSAQSLAEQVNDLIENDGYSLQGGVSIAGLSTGGFLWSQALVKYPELNSFHLTGKAIFHTLETLPNSQTVHADMANLVKTKSSYKASECRWNGCHNDRPLFDSLCLTHRTMLSKPDDLSKSKANDTLGGMKVIRKEDNADVSEQVVVEFDKSGKPAFVRSKNDDRDPDRQPVSKFTITGLPTDAKTVTNVVEK